MADEIWSGSRKLLNKRLMTARHKRFGHGRKRDQNDESEKYERAVKAVDSVTVCRELGAQWPF